MIAIERASTAFLRNVTLRVERGEILAIVGASGSGKTTVLRTVLGLDPLAEGTIAIDGRIASSGKTIAIPPEERDLSVVFQDVALWPNMTVRGNLAFALESRGAKDVDAKIAAMLERVGLADKSDRRPDQLSGGERQRVSLARALVVEPKAILLDEPLAGVDVLLRRELLDLVQRTFRERNATALYVTHDPREARALGDRIAVLDAGALVQIGTFDELRAKPATKLVEAIVAET